MENKEIPELAKEAEVLYPTPEEANLYDLLDRDIVVDIKILATLQGNLTALRGWLAGIQDLKTRETFRMFLEDTKGVFVAMRKQHDLQLGTIRKFKAKWEASQKAPSA